MSDTNTQLPLTAKDFKGKVNPDWCPGCGDFGVLNGLQRAVSELGLQPHQILTISGIGARLTCRASSNPTGCTPYMVGLYPMLPGLNLLTTR